MGEVKPVKMDNWAPTDSATLFADGKALTLTLSSGFSKYLFCRGTCALLPWSAYLRSQSAQNKTRNYAGWVLHTLCGLEQKV